MDCTDYENAQNGPKNADKRGISDGWTGRDADGKKTGSGKHDGHKDGRPTRDERGARLKVYRRFKKGRDFHETPPERAEAYIDLMYRAIGMQPDPDGVYKPAEPYDLETVDGFLYAAQQYIDWLNTQAARGVDIYPDVEGFCSFCGTYRDHLSNLARRGSEPLRQIIKQTVNSFATWKKQAALRGEIPAVVFAVDFNNNHGYVQKPVVEFNQNTAVIDLPSAADIKARLQAVNPPRIDENKLKKGLPGG